MPYIKLKFETSIMAAVTAINEVNEANQITEETEQNVPEETSTKKRPRTSPQASLQNHKNPRTSSSQIHKTNNTMDQNLEENE